MLFDIQRRSLYSHEGRVLLRTRIMFPLTDDSVQQQYIIEFVKTCESFANDILYPKLLLINSSNKFVYHYEVTVNEVCMADAKTSFVILSKLSHKETVIASGIKTISFIEDKIVPPKLIACKSKYRYSSLIFDNEGNPSKVSLVKGRLLIESIT